MWKLTITQKGKYEVAGREYDSTEKVAFVSENLTELAAHAEALMCLEGLHETTYKIESMEDWGEDK